MKPTYSIDNNNGIALELCHTRVNVKTENGMHAADDEIMLFVAKYNMYDADLVQNGDLMLRFTKAQAARLARRLWQMSRQLQTATKRDAQGNGDIILVPNELLTNMENEQTP